MPRKPGKGPGGHRHRAKRPMHVAGLIERHDNAILIALPMDESGPDRHWLFPRGPAQPGEAPETAMRRVARETLGFDVEIVVGQPPLLEVMDGVEIEVRYFFCGVIKQKPIKPQYAETRWVSKAHLSEYEFAESARPIVDWLQSE